MGAGLDAGLHPGRVFVPQLAPETLETGLSPVQFAPGDQGLKHRQQKRARSLRPLRLHLFRGQPQASAPALHGKQRVAQGRIHLIEFPATLQGAPRLRGQQVVLGAGLPRFPLSRLMGRAPTHHALLPTAEPQVEQMPLGRVQVAGQRGPQRGQAGPQRIEHARVCSVFVAEGVGSVASLLLGLHVQNGGFGRGQTSHSHGFVMPTHFVQGDAARLPAHGPHPFPGPAYGVPGLPAQSRGQGAAVHGEADAGHGPEALRFLILRHFGHVFLL